jgi:Zn-dependent protease with chaperone function
MQPSRREFVLGSLSGCALCGLAPAALARVLPTDLTRVVKSGYRPVDADERGLWQACDRLEQELAASKLRFKDAPLESYLRGVVGRLLGEQAADLRIYPVRNPEFNAAMLPNGIMIVHTGLLVRMRNEAQLAAVLGHESGHYLRRHSVKSWRDLKSKTSAMSFLAIAGAAAGGAAGYGLASGLNATLALSLFSFSRELESEADAFGLQLLNAAGYPPEAAAEIWGQLISERRASATERKKPYKDRSLSAISTHPPTEERMRDLTDTAAALAKRSPDAHHDSGRDEWLAAVTPLRPMLLDEQIKLNDPGASLYLINSLARDGWDGLLRFYEGEAYRFRAESGDEARAEQAYAAAVASGDAPAEAFRAHGYALLREGKSEQGRQALSRYLELAPHAVDAEMVRFSIRQ